jgi:Ca-activated chloride channel homolog
MSLEAHMNRRTCLVLSIVAALLLVSPLAPAQGRKTRITPPPEPTPEPMPVPTPVTRPPALVVDEAGDPIPMLVDHVDTKVVIRGLLAETTMTMTFRNPHNRVLEGELFFPLPEGSTVSGYGLDVGGELVEGVVVEKHQARIAFETEVRKGVDPGLVEWVRGNSFRTRVYPIPASGTRTVLVRYVSDLIGGADEAVYLLPLDFEEQVGQFDLEVTVVHGENKPKVTGGLANFEFDKAEDRWVASASRKDVKLTDDLRVALPKLPAQLVSIERDGDGFVFVVHDAPTEPTSRRPTKASPKRVALWWDASLSRDGADREAELALVGELVARWKKLTVDVVPFRDALDAVTTFEIVGGDGTALIDHLRQIPDDGGTDLAALELGTDYDLHLLVSDGLGTIGKAPASAPEAPLFTITSDSSADHALLRHFASGSGGAHVDLTRTTVADAADHFAGTPFSLLGVEADPSQVAALHPRGRRPVAGRVHVTGRLLAESAQLTLLYGYGNDAVLRVPVQLDRSSASETGLVPRFWAQQEVTELSVMPDRDNVALLELGRRYGIVTPGASLLVLETLEQHLEHGVTPPVSRVELYAAWQQHKAQVKQITTDARAAKIEEVVAMWQARVEWWETDFSGWKREVGKVTGGERSRDDEDSEPEAERRMDAPVTTSRTAEMQRESRPSARRGSGGGVARSEAPMEEADDSFSSGMKKEKGGASESVAADITIQPWDPKTPYIANLRAAAPKGRAYQVYIDQRAGYGSSPAYYLDCGHFFYAEGDAVLGRRILTSILELQLDDPSLLRVVAYRLAEAGELDLAIQLLDDVLELRPEEPQSLRDLALMLARRGQDEARRAADVEAADADLGRSMELLHQVVLGRWDRFAEIEVLALMELNRTWSLADRLPKSSSKRIARPDLDPRLRKLLDVDVRITLSWDADLTDVDLWIIEPTGEKAFYSNPRSAIGGNVSRDFTQGYGPEEYCLRKAVEGNYLIQANYYGSSQQTLLGPATVKAVVITNFGRPDEARQELTLRLDKVQDVVTVGEIALAP